jgi:hypothetical protein
MLAVVKVEDARARAVQLPAWNEPSDYRARGISNGPLRVRNPRV